MEIIFLIVILLVLSGGLAAIFILLRNYLQKKSGDQSLILLQNQINEISRTLDNKLGESTRFIQRQFGESTKIIKEITRELTKVGEGQKQVVDIAKQLDNLQDILKNPKQRGMLGEYFLKNLLENVFSPGQFQMQYEFKDGSVVDAVIFTRDRIIPIDSKFSLENYNRLLGTKEESERRRLEAVFREDLKNRIDETAKYIKPEEGTLEFAFMFIPSEAVYYDLLINKVGSVVARDLIEYAFVDKKVIIVSPTSFLAYLQTVLQGLKALQIEESAKEIGKRVEELRRHLITYDEYFKKIGVHLGTTVSMYNRAQKELGKIDKDVLKITGKAVGTKPLNLESPEIKNENGE